MNNRIISGGAVLLIALVLPTITASFLNLVPSNAFGQQGIFDSVDKGSDLSAWSTIGNYNSGYNIIPVSTAANDSIAIPLANMNQTIPLISAVDEINSTYIVPKEVNENESERRISRAIRDRINDILHTIVMNNATIISTTTITNSFVNESTTINNHTRLLEVIPDQVEAALAAIRVMSQPTNAALELHTGIDAKCSANNAAHAECNMNIRIH
jgi:hypothetical protein